VVFNTSMTGYQEILTDPSYCQQIVTLTYPHIGNYGTNGQDAESDRVQAAGLIIKDLPLVASSFRSEATLSQYLLAQGTVAIANLDTRGLTRHLRSQGAQNGCILALAPGSAVDQAAIERAVHGRSGPGPCRQRQGFAYVDADRVVSGGARGQTRLRRSAAAAFPCRGL
jgi:carbamoyl-phosphate synthase small subunit